MKRASSSQSFLLDRSLLYHSRSQDLVEDLNYPLPDHLAVFARLGAKVANETSLSPIGALKIVDVASRNPRKRLGGRQRLIAKSLLDRASAFEIKIKDFEAKGFLRSEVIGKRTLTQPY